MKKILISLFIISVVLVSCARKGPTPNTKRSKVLKASMEYAYMEGQIDYKMGKVHIESTNNDYVWSSSPWNSGEDPEFNSRSEYPYGTGE